MADKKLFENIFQNKIAQTQIQDENLKSYQNVLQESVKQIQLSYNDKKEFRKSSVPQLITENLADSLNMLNTKQQQIVKLEKQLEEKNKLIQKENETQQKQSLQIQDLTQKLNQKEKQNNDAIKKKSDEIEALKKELDALMKKKNCDETFVEETNKYDIILDIKSLLNIQKESIKIQYPQSNKLTKQNLSEMELCSVVGIQGLKNKGKTFLLNELNGENFPSGFHYSTKGISVKVDNTDSNNIKVYLDSEGINKPARYKWKDDSDFTNYIKIKRENVSDRLCQNTDEVYLQKKVQTKVFEKFQDIKSTEQILQQFLLENSETIIIVVGIISLEEQKIISIISEVCDKDIIIVHNLKEYSQIKHVQKEIESNLEDFFPLDQQGIELYRYKNDQFNSVFQDQRNERIFHCILAKKGSPAGDFYNQFTYDFIKQKIQLNQIKKSLNFANDFFYFLNKNLQNFVELQYSSEEKKNQKIQPQEQLLQLIESDEIDEIALKPEFQITTIKDILLDVFGRIRHSVNYSIYQQNNIKTVVMELPGDVTLSKASLLKEDEYLVLVIQANKKTSQQDQTDIQEIFNNRNLGLISHKIRIGKTTENLVLKSPFSCKKGVYTCTFEIIKNFTQLTIETSK